MPIFEFPGAPKDLDVPYIDRIGDSRPKAPQGYTVENPHPGFGKDPNIVNELGHTQYPKMVYPNGSQGAGVVANSPEEEATIMGKQSQPEQKKAAW